MTALDTGAVIGILGGGQLGRMLAFAAHRLGFRVHGFSPEPDSPLAQVTGRLTCAGYSDEAALAEFAGAVDVVTFEFENVPAAAVEFLEARRPVRPQSGALTVTQDRLAEKRFLERTGIPVAPFAPVSKLDDLSTGILATGLPAVLKTRRFGYDGKGQAPIDSGAEMETAWQAVAQADSVMETKIGFDREVSVIAARGPDGTVRTYPVTENRHVDHILHTSIAPADVAATVARSAADMARAILAALDYVGVMGIEFFLQEDALVVNEMAPRVHNSGHWTIEGAATSQFEQHIRAVAGLPLGPADALFKAEMTNLLGDAVKDWRARLDDPAAHVHVYGKHDIRPGRKMGHVTRLSAL